jgi:hypothetical protein
MYSIDTTTKESKFISAYFAAVNFTETGDIDEPKGGAELDEEFTRESIIDCLAFYSSIACYITDEQIEQSGHDFWMTRNGHGTGFWDRPGTYGAYHSDKFTEHAEAFGEVEVVFEEQQQ